MMLLPRDEQLGALVAVAIYTLCILLFTARIAARPACAQGLGAGLLLAVVPLTYLALRGPRWERPPIFYVQVGLMIFYLIVEFVLDYWPRVEFRETRWAVISYVTLFFGGTGGMIGVAALAGRGWGIAAVVLFLVMALLTFVQHVVTGS